jgi:hypothetical protein
MTAREKAQSGLSLLKEAVLEYLAKQPGGAALVTEIREGLGLEDSDREGQRKGHLLWGLGNLLEREGRMRPEKRDGRSYIVLV